MEFRCYRIYELKYTLFSAYFRLMAAIFDFQHTQTSESIPTSLSVLLDCKTLVIVSGEYGGCPALLTQYSCLDYAKLLSGTHKRASIPPQIKKPGLDLSYSAK